MWAANPDADLSDDTKMHRASDSFDSLFYFASLSTPLFKNDASSPNRKRKQRRSSITDIATIEKALLFSRTHRPSKKAMKDRTTLYQEFHTSSSRSVSRSQTPTSWNEQPVVETEDLFASPATRLKDVPLVARAPGALAPALCKVAKRRGPMTLRYSKLRVQVKLHKRSLNRKSWRDAVQKKRDSLIDRVYAKISDSEDEDNAAATTTATTTTTTTTTTTGVNQVELVVSGDETPDHGDSPIAAPVIGHVQKKRKTSQ